MDVVQGPLSWGKAKAQARAKVEHPFRVIKRQFGYVKVRFRGLAGQEHRSAGDAVRAVEPMDGAPTFADYRRRGTPVMRKMAAARCSRRPKRRTERVTWSILIDGPLSKAARAEVDRKYRAT